MMSSVLKIAIGALGLISVAAGLGFWLMPVRHARMLGVTTFGPLLPLGDATLRADFGAIFLACGLCALLALWRRRGDFLLVPALLMGLALAGRLISLAVMGGGMTEIAPMLVEAAACGLALAGRRVITS